MSNKRIVLDTNVLISRILQPSSIPGQVVKRVITNETLLISDALLLEVMEVLSRPKFKAFVDPIDAQNFLQALSNLAERIEVTTHVKACRDPKDDYILELAVSGFAHFIITGDSDLLALHPFRNISIITPKYFLESVA